MIQDIVLQDQQARRATQRAVDDLLALLCDLQPESDRRSGRGLRERKEVCLSVCCHAGTHRSVAIGERIAQGVKREAGRMGGGEGVRVVVRHVHRAKMVSDPF